MEIDDIKVNDDYCVNIEIKPVHISYKGLDDIFNYSKILEFYSYKLPKCTFKATMKNDKRDIIGMDLSDIEFCYDTLKAKFIGWSRIDGKPMFTTISGNKTLGEYFSHAITLNATINGKDISFSLTDYNLINTFGDDTSVRNSIIGLKKADIVSDLELIKIENGRETVEAELFNCMLSSFSNANSYEIADYSDITFTADHYIRTFNEGSSCDKADRLISNMNNIKTMVPFGYCNGRYIDSDFEDEDGWFEFDNENYDSEDDEYEEDDVFGLTEEDENKESQYIPSKQIEKYNLTLLFV
jgi:hypothetical protein